MLSGALKWDARIQSEPQDFRRTFSLHLRTHLAVDAIRSSQMGCSDTIRASRFPTYLFPSSSHTSCSRCYQELSNGMLGYNQSLKISDVPFPFIFAHILQSMLSGALKWDARIQSEPQDFRRTFSLHL